MWKQIEPPKGLFNRIMARINEEELMLSARKRFVLFSSLAIVSMGAFVPVVGILQAEFAQSGFTQFLSLIFSDLNSVMMNWREFGMAVLESLPTMSIILSLTLSLVFLWSLKQVSHISWSMKHIT